MSAVIIPARIGSTRFPAKVLALIDGVPMVVRTAMQAIKSKADKVIVTSDSEEVLNLFKDIDEVSTVLSGSDIKTGTDRVALITQNIPDEVIINLQSDEPFIDYKLIDQLIDELSIDNSNFKMITAATLFNDINDVTNPSYVKVVFNSFNLALYFSRSVIPYNRDNIAGVSYYKHIGIYGYRRDFLFWILSKPRTSLEISENLEQLRVLEHGYNIKVVETDYNPISVDTAEDLIIADNYSKSLRGK